MGVENHRLEILFLSPAERGKGLELEKLPLDKDISFDGTDLGSRAEIILYEFLKNLGIVSEDNRPIDTGPYSYWLTFIIDGKKVYLKHMGKLEGP